MSSEYKAINAACEAHVSKVMDYHDRVCGNGVMEAAIKKAFAAGWSARASYVPKSADTRQAWRCETCGAMTLAPTEGDARSNLIEFSKRRKVDFDLISDPLGLKPSVATCKHFNIVPVIVDDPAQR
jgi:hypothetical protein